LKRLLLIDGDEFLFRACAAVEKEVKFNVILGEVDWNEPPIHVLGSNPVQAREVLDEMLDRIFERFETREHVMCFSAPPNFRYTVDPSYKNNRANSRKPLCYVDLREQVEADFNCKALPGLEADDVMGIIATTPAIQKRNPIIVSQDKDMQTIPTSVWRQGELINVTEEMADYYHMFQTLVGDTSDGYKGCPGVGKVKAEKLLTDPEGAGEDSNGIEYVEKEGKLWPRVVHAYRKYGQLGPDAALTQARLARILRRSDWDDVKKEPILWSPS
jgi:DNA polymerase-1